MIQVERELLDLSLIDHLISLLTLQSFLHLKNHLVSLIRSLAHLCDLLLKLRLSLLQLMNLLRLHHDLAIGFHDFLLFLSQVLRGLLLLMLDLADQLVELRLRHVGQLGVEVGTEKVADRVRLERAVDDASSSNSHDRACPNRIKS